MAFPALPIHSAWLLAGFAVVVAVLLTIAWWEWQRRGRSAKLLAKLSATCAHQERALEAWRSYFFDAQGREQRRITGELHDGVVQHLAGINLLVRGLETRLRQTGEDTLVEEATRIAELLRETSERAQARLLAEPGSRNGGSESNGRRDLARELADLARSTEARFMTPCAYSGPASVTLPGDTTEQLRAIAETALFNTLHHANPQSLTLHLGAPRPGAQEEGLLLAVEAEGRGFGDNGEGKVSRSQRLMILRAERLGGRIAYSPDSPRGTRLECRVPTAAENPTHE